MKTKNTISYIGLMMLFLSLVGSFSGCSRKDPDKYGQDISNPNATKIADILKEPQNFDGKIVTVQGQIIRECPSGCWFEVKENSAIIYVDINPSGFAIPQKLGKTVTVEGKIMIKDNQPKMVGTGVEIQ